MYNKMTIILKCLNLQHIISTKTKHGEYVHIKYILDTIKSMKRRGGIGTYDRMKAGKRQKIWLSKKIHG